MGGKGLGPPASTPTIAPPHPAPCSVGLELWGVNFGGRTKPWSYRALRVCTTYVGALGEPPSAYAGADNQWVLHVNV